MRQKDHSVPKGNVPIVKRTVSHEPSAVKTPSVRRQEQKDDRGESMLTLLHLDSGCSAVGWNSAHSGRRYRS